MESNLPKPIDKMTDEELWGHLETPHGICYPGPVIGNSAIGPVVKVSQEVAEVLGRVAKS